MIIRGVKRSHLQEKLKEEEMRRMEAEGTLPLEEEIVEEEKPTSGEPVIAA